MNIRKATKEDRKEAAVLIYDAIHDIAHVLTGEIDKEKVLVQLEEFFCQETNRMSYHNCLVKTVDHQVVGLVIAYHGSDALQLDEPIYRHLQSKQPNVESIIDPEADEKDYYLDTLSVNPSFGGKGFGTELIKATINYSLELGYSSVSLNVEENNTKARQLYERLGFEFEKNITINHHTYAYMVKYV
ncbi:MULTISPECIES: GNAT family N-acetyltransferase [Bacillus]|uniref:GNAT family N-acetyltransferase n=1 Tax=Bacillus TaxID=1386 RepID=UPI00031CBC7E|nr:MULTISPECIES: GNAT family N-acetyltransferase [Bacillus]